MFMSSKKKASTLSSLPTPIDTSKAEKMKSSTTIFSKITEIFSKSKPKKINGRTGVEPSPVLYVDTNAFSTNTSSRPSKKGIKSNDQLRSDIHTENTVPIRTISYKGSRNYESVSPTSLQVAKRSSETSTTKQTLESTPQSNPTSESLASSGSSPTKSKNGGLCCDKCDGKHATDDCPYYKKPRETHPDAQRGKKMGGLSILPGAVIRVANVVRQPGDGSCLFHSMSYGLRSGMTADRLRHDICQYIKHNPSLKISDTPLSDWVKWDSNLTCAEYARRMSSGTWGGGIEMACTSLMHRCNVHVYERTITGFKRISAFDYPENPETLPVVRVLYCGGVHYDALVVNSIKENTRSYLGAIL